MPRSVAAAVALLPLAVIGNACGGLEFCEDGDEECAPSTGGSADTAGGGTGDGGSASIAEAGAAQGGTDGGGGTAGTNGAGGGPGGNTCNLSDGASFESGCVAPDDGIFVAPAVGDREPDDNAGTKADPFVTVAQGITRAVEKGLPVFICNTKFEEALVLDEISDLRIYGGFS